jgi:hypothetical protein
MRLISRKLVLTVAAVCGFALAMVGQESQSLGDVARQSRLQKQNKNEVQSKTAGTAKSKVITNEEIGHQSEPATEAPGTASKEQGAADSHPSSGRPKMPAEQWKSLIQAQKQAISTQQSNIDKLNDSIQFAPANCVSGCVQWNENQKRKQAEVERMRSQLETLKQHLQEMQEAARQQGYGSSVYDP